MTNLETNINRNVTFSPRLAAAAERARAAVLSAGAVELAPAAYRLQAGAAGPLLAPAEPVSLPAEVVSAYEVAQLPAVPSVVTVDKLGRFASCEAVSLSAGLSAGAARLFALLHAVAVRLAASRGYSSAVSQVVYSLPQSVVAAGLGYTDRHVRRLTAELEAAGLLAASPYASRVAGRSMWATVVWAVKLSTTRTAPRIRADDWAHCWRDLAGDIKRKNTVLGKMSELVKMPKVDMWGQLHRMAVTGVFSISPVTDSFSSDIHISAVSDAVSSLSLLADSPPSERRDLIHQLAGWLSEGLNDSHSFRWWCGLLWRCCGSWEQIGALQAQLSRLLADLVEWDGVRSPGAWFAARVA